MTTLCLRKCASSKLPLNLGSATATQRTRCLRYNRLRYLLAKNPPCYKNKEGEATPDTLNDQITQESLAFAVFAVTNVKLKRLFAVLLCVQTMSVTQRDIRSIDDSHILIHSIFSHGDTPPFKQRSNTQQTSCRRIREMLEKAGAIG